jgi:hypothetical protein
MPDLPIFEIDNTPECVKELMSKGSFFSHFDGRWRYMPYGGEVHYTDSDPTEHFPHKAEFKNACAGAACPELGIYAQIHGDGTRGLREFDRDRTLVLNQIYAPRHDGEREFRKWLLDTMPKA